jgi:hypothetical protein
MNSEPEERSALRAPLESTKLFLLMLLGELGLGVSGAFIAWLVFWNDHNEFAIPWDWRPSVLLLGICAALPICLALPLLQNSRWPPLVEFRQYLARHVMPTFAGWSWRQLLVISVAAGFCEELLFRGLQAWATVYLPPIVALLVVSLLFGAAHALTRFYFFLATLMGLYFGALFLASGNLVIPMVAHGVYDAVALWWLTQESQGDEINLTEAAE